jgi:parallel beta-helix repeat protein
MKSAVATIQNNTISNAGTGIQLSCGADNNVSSNTISDAVTGLSTVPAAFTATNTFFNVGTISSGGC